MIAGAPEPLSTILAVTAVLGLRIGETLALRVSDLDFAQRIIRVRQSVDAATRTLQGVKSKASSADLPMSKELEARLRTHLKNYDGKSELLFVNRRGRPFSANKLREKQLHPLLVKLGIARGGFHAARLVQPVLCSQTVRPRLWCRDSYGTVTQGLRWEFTVMSSAMSSAVLFRIARQDW
jgi:integrase